MTTFKNFIPFLALVFSASMITSCDKADKNVEAISESDASEIIEANLQNNAGGLVSKLKDVGAQIIDAVAAGELCDSLYTATIEESFQGVRFQASYSSNLFYEISCNQFGFPQTATVAMLTSTMYNSTRIMSNDVGEFNGQVTGLQPFALTFNIGGEYIRTGEQDLNFMSQKNITSTLTINLTNLEISKLSLEIESGKGTILLTGSTTNQSFSFEGDIVFNGGNTATLTINGTTYDLDWN